MLEREAALPAKLFAAIAAGTALIFAALAFFPPWQHLELKGFDALTLATAPEQSVLPITIVGIDEASFAQVGKKWPWPTDVHAKLVDSIARAGALAIVLDVLIAEPGREEEDASFAKAISRAGNVILVSDRAFQETRYARQWIRVDPLPRFVEAGAVPGFAGVTLDRDQVVREMPAGGDVLWRTIVKRV
ncbi:MAG TPA: CHASE2 domain-containing protein, partial [Usitatibacter sp.]|nr:CHASE2 domain-containing protein [Usitatibacter sp.]